MRLRSPSRCECECECECALALAFAAVENNVSSAGAVESESRFYVPAVSRDEARGLRHTLADARTTTFGGLSFWNFVGARRP